jgi:hypothetical protein
MCITFAKKKNSISASGTINNQSVDSFTLTGQPGKAEGSSTIFAAKAHSRMK